MKINIWQLCIGRRR